MGLFLTLLYILTAYLGPETLWGPLYAYHIEIILAALAFLASVPAIQRSKLFNIPQSYALVGMCVAVFCSMVMTGWLGSILPAVLAFIPSAFTFFLVIINFRTKRHLQLLVLTMLLFCAFPIYKGYTALHTGNFYSPYLMPQGSDEGGYIYRLRGMAFINDPNDFSQVMVSLIPCLFFFWKKRSPLNFIFVLPATALLIFGMYLTHSRGGIVALLAVLLFAFRRKIGTIPSAILAAGFFALTSVLNWSGGREVSVEAGADRMEAWSVGLELIKTHPLFGVGLGRFGEYFIITAHNTIVVCAAELGMFGLFWWVMFVLPTVRDASVCSQWKKPKPIEEDSFSYDRPYGVRQNSSALLRQESIPYFAPEQTASTAVATAAGPFRTEQESSRGTPLHLASTQDEEDGPKLPPEEIERIAHLMLTSIVGYFVAGWFLSRAFVMTLFIYGGMVQVIYRMALAQNIAPPRLKAFKVAQYSAIASVGLVLVVYVMLRLQHLFGM